jgi:mono/diheme cytochrome c family protein
MSSEPRASKTLSAPLYLLCVALVSAVGIGAAMMLRPAFGHRMLEFAGLETRPQAAPGSFYTARVAPLFDQHCVSCHGENRQKADLRLDSYAFALRGGRHGAVIVPGNLKASEMMTRITLPAGDDKAMPPEGKTPLTPDDITVIRLWIATGALPTVAAIKGAPKLVAEVKIPQPDPAAARRQRAPLAAAVQQLMQRYPGLLVYQSRNSADLELNAALRGTGFTDADLKAFLSVRARIIRMDLSGTGVTDACAQTLAQMTALRFLRLAGTHISRAALAPLAKRGVVLHGDDNAD